MLNVALYEPEIPPNTGNIIRLCANVGSPLHLIEPLGFELDDKRLRRAGLDYHEFAQLKIHANLQAFNEAVKPRRLFGISTKGAKWLHQTEFKPNDVLLFGPETRGLPAEVLAALGDEQILRLPMLPEQRSLNLSNAVAISLYEVWRQFDFAKAI